MVFWRPRPMNYALDPIVWSILYKRNENSVCVEFAATFSKLLVLITGLLLVVLGKWQISRPPSLKNFTIPDLIELMKQEK